MRISIVESAQFIRARDWPSLVGKSTRWRDSGATRTHTTAENGKGCCVESTHAPAEVIKSVLARDLATHQPNKTEQPNAEQRQAAGFRNQLEVVRGRSGA